MVLAGLRGNDDEDLKAVRIDGGHGRMTEMPVTCTRSCTFDRNLIGVTEPAGADGFANMVLG